MTVYKVSLRCYKGGIPAVTSPGINCLVKVFSKGNVTHEHVYYRLVFIRDIYHILEQRVPVVSMPVSVSIYITHRDKAAATSCFVLEVPYRLFAILLVLHQYVLEPVRKNRLYRLFIS